MCNDKYIARRCLVNNLSEEQKMQVQLMAQGQIPIKGLLNEYEAPLTELGNGFSTRLNFLKRAELIAHRYENLGLEYFDPNIIAEYAREIDERYFSGQIKKLYY
jgi:hypothetical protein